MRFLILITFAFTCACLSAQRSAKIDSILSLKRNYVFISTELWEKCTQEELETALRTEKNEQVRLKLLNALCFSNFNSDPKKALDYAKEQMDLAIRVNNEAAIEVGYDNFGFLYKVLGEYEKSLSYHLKSLKIKEQKKDSAGISICMNGIGGLYYSLENFPKALEYFLKETHIDSLLNNKENLIDNYGNIGVCYNDMAQPNKALTYYKLAEEISKSIGRKASADLLQNMGSLYLKNGDLEKAREYLNKALAYALQEDNIATIVVANIALGDLYAQRKEYPEAIRFEEEALLLSRQNKLIEQEIQTLRSISNTYARSGDYPRAFKYQTMFTELKDTLLKQESARAITEMNTKYQTDKKEKQIEIQNLSLAQQKLALNKKQIIIYATAGGIGLMLLLSFFIYRGYRQKKQANVDLTEKNLIIAEKSKIVEEQHKDITDSIRYAQRIQQAILPPAKFWHELLPNSFVLYKPKDILSGDFYWIEQNADSVFVAAADCTGHGVPGALMSLVNYNLLNKAVLEKNLTKPADILDEVNRSLTVSLHQTYNESAVRDGMDIALCAIHKKNRSAQFAGAFNGGYIFGKNGEFRELNGDKKPVGAFIEDKIASFTNQLVELKKGDRVFIFSDGYADQFGGHSGKKLKYTRLKQYLTESMHLDMPRQKEYLEACFNAWKANFEQVDDVLVIGFAIL